MVRPSPIRIVAPLVLATGILTACGSSQRDSTSTAPTPSGQPIVIGIISDTTQAGGGGLPEVPVAASARVQHINAHGGINGRPVRLVSCDTKQDPNAARMCARTVVDSGAVAVVGVTSTADASVLPILEQADVPAIGTIPLTPVAGDSKVAYCFGPGIAGAFMATAPAVAAAGATKVGLIYPSNVGATSESARAAFELGARNGNVATGPVVGFGWGETQFDAPIAKATAGGVDGVVVNAPGSSEATLLAAMRQQRSDVKVSTLAVALTPQIIEALGGAAEGVVAVGFTQPATAEDLPGIAAFNQDMDRFGKSANRTDIAINAWTSVWAFEQIARKLPTISRATVAQAMDDVEDLDLGGIYPPLSARGTSPKAPGLSCAMSTSVVFDKVQNSQLVALEPGSFYDPFAKAR